MAGRRGDRSSRYRDCDESGTRHHLRAGAGAVTLVRSQPVTSGASLPLAVLSYVRQTGESVVVGDARTDERFASDPYIISTQLRSMLCLPIVHHGTLSGMLYLEHHLASDAFTPDS